MNEKYHVVLRKKSSSSDIAGAYVQYDGFESAGGAITGQIEYKTMFANKEAAIPKKVNVRWISSGRKYTKEIRIFEKLPHPFEGELVFIFDGNEVLFQWIVKSISDDSKGVWR